MKLVVTGGSGYKGSILVPKLLNAGHEVTVYDVQWFGNFLPAHPQLKVIKHDVRDIDAVNLAGIDGIIHLASVANDPCSELEPTLTWEISALATMQLADKAVREGVKHFIYASSGSVYGVSDAPQVTEELVLTPISEYNKTKMVAERVLLSYADKFCLQVIRPATVCGYSPRMRLDLSVNMMVMQALSRGVMTVFGGDQVRPNIHIDDITDLYVFLLNRPDIQGVYNAGFENLSILDIAKRVQQVVKADIQVTPSNDPRSYRLNSDKLLATGYRPKKSVAIAIAEIVAAYQAGKLIDQPNFYNIKTMTAMKEAELVHA